MHKYKDNPYPPKAFCDMVYVIDQIIGSIAWYLINHTKDITDIDSSYEFIGDELFKNVDNYYKDY